MNISESVLEKLRIANEIRKRPSCDKCGKDGIAVLIDRIYCGDCYVEICKKLTAEKNKAILKIIEG